MNNKGIPPWREELMATQKKEGKYSSNNWIQIATINNENKPRLRTVVFRGWESGNSLIIYSDKRSQKIYDIKQNNSVEILWFFSKTKSQYRLKGEAYFVEETKKYWEKLSQDAKKTWFWPSPGKNLEKFSISQINDDLEMPNNFTVLTINVQSVDLLRLKSPIHKRYFWHINNNWERIEINP